MLNYLREHSQFYLLIVLWVISGALLGTLAIIPVVLSMLLLLAREDFAGLIIAFWLMLIFSDSRLGILEFSQVAKKILIVMTLMFLFLKRHVLNIGSNAVFNIFMPFFIWSICLTLRSPEISVSVQKTFSYIFLFLIVPVLGHKAIEDDQRAFFKRLIYTLAFYLLIGLAMQFVNPELVHLDGRFMGIMGNPNGLGLMVFLIGMLFDTMCRKDPTFLSRNTKYFIWAIIIANLLLCQSRTSLFALIVYLGFSKFKVLRGGFGTVIFAIVAASYGYFTQNLPALVKQFGLGDIIRTENIAEGSGRYIAWEFGWKQVQENFFVGKGFSYTEWIYHENYTMLSRMGHLGNAHNSFLTFWMDTGLIGLVLFLISFFLLFFRLVKVSPTAFPFLYAILISAFFESWLTASLNPNTICVLLTATIMMYASQAGAEQDTLDLEMQKMQSDE